MNTHAHLSSPSRPSPSAAPPPNGAAEHLPDDPALLKQMILELLATLHAKDHELESARQRLDNLLRRLYGPRAERYDPNQPLLFADLLQQPAAQPQPEPQPEPAEEETPQKKRKPHGRRKMPNQLRRERVEHDLPEADKLCPCCGLPRTRIGAEVSEQLDYVPASLFVLEHVRFKYACTHCQGNVAVAAKPPQPIQKGLPGLGLLTHVFVCKYVDHLPLHRLERIFERQGVLLNRSTTCGWMKELADLLEPLYKEMKNYVRLSRILHTDDTPVPVLDATRDATRRGHIWLYWGDDHHPVAIFEFTPNHSNQGPKEFLKDYIGYLQADAYKGYDALYASARILEVACWAHARRYFFEAKETNPEVGHAALAWIRQLYDVEDEAKGMTALERQALRQTKSRPILTDFRQWLQEQEKQVLPKSPMGQAIRYALGNWTALCRYTDDGDLAIDNNVSERTLRQIVTGKKNWMFVGSDGGGKTAAILFSFAATCRRLKIDPFVYVRDVLARIGAHPQERLAELLPDRWLAARQPEAAAPADTS